MRLTSIHDHLDLPLWDNLRDKLSSRIWDKLWYQIGSQLWDKLREPIVERLDQLGGRTDDQLGEQEDIP